LGVHGAAADDVERAVSSHTCDPSGEISAAEERRVVPDLQEHGLRNVFGGGGFGKHAHRQSIDQAMVSVIQGLKRSGITGTHALHEAACIFHGPTLRCIRCLALLE